MRWILGLVLASIAVTAWADVRPPTPPTSQMAKPGKAGWSVDSRTGCWLWNPNPRPGETVAWSGACSPSGPASGKGEAAWTADGNKISRFIGELKLGRARGHGTYVWASGNRYEGEWVDGKRIGNGKIDWINGDRYEGEWLNGERSGRGTYTFSNGSYAGEWSDDHPNGQGKAVINGKTYEGEWLMGCFYAVDGEPAWIALKSGESCT